MYSYAQFHPAILFILEGHAKTIYIPLIYCWGPCQSHHHIPFIFDGYAKTISHLFLRATPKPYPIYFWGLRQNHVPLSHLFLRATPKPPPYPIYFWWLRQNHIPFIKRATPKPRSTFVFIFLRATPKPPLSIYFWGLRPIPIFKCWNAYFESKYGWNMSFT